MVSRQATIHNESEIGPSAGRGTSGPTIATIPEESTLPSGVRIPTVGASKSPSPLDSSAPTTGTTTTPTSVEHCPSPPGDRVDYSASSASSQHGLAPVFPMDSLHSATSAANVPQPWGQGGSTDESAPVYRVEPSQAQPNQPYGLASGFPEQHRSNLSQQQPFGAALKLLVSNNVAGSIIGRSGQTISELQTQSLTRIKLSQSGDFFPGTQDRVCLVQGETRNVKLGLKLLLERLYMLQEHQHSQHMAWQLQKQKAGNSPAFDFVVKVLVPTSSCGMIIGKSGSNIKYMEETTGVTSVRLSPKDSNADPAAGFAGGGPAAILFSTNTSERIVTVTGATLESCVECLYLVIDAMVAHPEICRYANMTTSYARVPTEGFAPTASPSSIRAAANMGMQPRQTSPEHQVWDPTSHIPSGYGPSIPGLPRRISSSPDLGIGMQMLEPKSPDGHIIYPSSGNVGMLSVGSGAALPTVPHLHMAPTSLVPSNPVGPSYLIPPPQPHHQVRCNDPPKRPFSADLHEQPPGQPFPSSGVRGSSAVHHSLSAPDLSAYLEHSMHISSLPPASLPLHLHPQQASLTPSVPSQAIPPAPSPLSSDFPEAFSPQPPTMTGPGCFTSQVLVPDSMIGSILGRGGRALSELQILSGTRIRISQRGEFMPGTRARIVTLRGPTAQTVWQAQYLMSQRMVLPQTALGAGSSSSSPLLYPSTRPSYPIGVPEIATESAYHMQEVRAGPPPTAQQSSLEDPAASAIPMTTAGPVEAAAAPI